jgi:hypothetical protein
LNDGRIHNPSNPFGVVPLSDFVPRVLDLSIVQGPFSITKCQTYAYLTIRNFFIAVVRGSWWRQRTARWGACRGRCTARTWLRQVRFCRDLVFPYRRVRIQGDQGRGGLGYRSTISLPLLLVFFGVKIESITCLLVLLIPNQVALEFKSVAAKSDMATATAGWTAVPILLCIQTAWQCLRIASDTWLQRFTDGQLPHVSTKHFLAMYAALVGHTTPSAPGQAHPKTITSLRNSYDLKRRPPGSLSGILR